MARISIIVAFACKKLAASGIIRQRNNWEIVADKLSAAVGHGVIVALSRAMVGVGSLMRTKTTANAISSNSDELLSAFLELEKTLM
jgi:hypothetical protein